MNEEDLKKKEEVLDSVIQAYEDASERTRKAKEYYEEWIGKMQRASFLAGIALGISIAALCFNLAKMFV